MSIVTSEIVKTRIDGSRMYVFEKHTDDSGNTYDNRYITYTGDDINSRLATNTQKVQNELEKLEEDTLQKSVEEGLDPENITLKHISNRQRAIAVAKGLMFGEPRRVIKSAEFISRFSDVQLSNFFTANQITKLRNRQNYILNNLNVINNDTREKL